MAGSHNPIFSYLLMVICVSVSNDGENHHHGVSVSVYNGGAGSIN